MIFQINFFLFNFAISNILSYLCVYAKYYANVTNSQFGVIAMLLPALALFAKPISCAITDARGIHRQFLIGALCVLGICFGSLGVVGFIKDPNDHEHDLITWLVIGFLMTCGYVATACTYCMNDALASNYARKNNLSYSRMRIWGNLGYAAGALLIMMIGDSPWLPPRVPGCILLSIAIVIDVLFLTFWPYEEDFEMFHDGTTVEQRKLSIVGPATKAYLAQNKPRGSISRDMLEKIRANRSKSVGNLPRMDTQLSVPNQPVAKIKEEKEYSNFMCQMILIKIIAREHKSFVRYIFLFAMFGFVTGMLSTFLFDYLKARIVKSDAEFEFMSTLCLISQAVLGEIVINLVATDMIKLFGANANMSLALVSLGLRCFFYSQILPYTGIWFVVISEALQGPSSGLYWVLIVDVGSNYALMVPDYMPEMRRLGVVRDKAHEMELNGCLRASMIGIMSASTEGLGNALGSYAGGLVITMFGYDWLWNTGAILAISFGFLNIGWDVATKLLFKKQSKQEKVKDDGNIPTVVVEEIKL